MTTGDTIMSAKTSKKAASSYSGDLADAARNVWLAGLGAYSKAFQFANKQFDVLVAEGRDTQTRIVKAEKETLSEVKDKLDTVTTEASKRYARVENMLQTQGSKVVNKLGLPTVDDVRELSARVSRLDKKVRGLTRSAGDKVANAA